MRLECSPFMWYEDVFALTLRGDDGYVFAYVRWPRKQLQEWAQSAVADEEDLLLPPMTVERSTIRAIHLRGSHLAAAKPLIRAIADGSFFDSP